MIDLRSDTVTLPTDAMRAAMAAAELGDDVYGDDPTVNALEALAAERTDKAAAVFVPSGTMGNLAAVMAHCGRGDTAVVGDQCHIYHYEAGGTMVLGSVVLRSIPTQPSGELTLADISAVIHDDSDSHASPTKLVCLENTHNRCGGTVLTPEYTAQVHALTQSHGVALHLDGARVFNAAVALGVPVAAITRHVDSVTFCLSKGLSAPVGSVLCGDAEFIRRARRARKILGGGMRQAGVLAAAGVVALNTMVDRLAEDHANARILAEGLNAIPGIAVDLPHVQTDLVYFTLTNTSWPAARFAAALRERGVLMGGGGYGMRAVTHSGISTDDVETALETVRAVLVG